MSLPLHTHIRGLVGLGLCLAFAGPAYAAPDQQQLVTEVLKAFTDFRLSDGITAAASTLFWSLATISLVWTMGVHVVRQDFGDMLMELVRFMIVTGTFYWILINASPSDGGDGFVQLIIDTFFTLPMGEHGGATMHTNANNLMAHGLKVYFSTVDELAQADTADQILGVSLATIVLILLSCLAAQFLLVMTMAWILGYAGIFLLGFGGSRWSSAIAISYYKHVIALGIAILVLSIIGAVGTDVISRFGPAGAFGPTAVSEYAYLGMVVAGSVLMLVLGIRIPQLMYTLVTGSALGMFTGVATAAGTAFASGGGAIAGAMHRPTGGPPPASGADAVMAAATRGATAGDPFHVTSGTDPFGVPRRADPHRGGTVFGRSTGTVSPVDDSVTSVGRGTQVRTSNERGQGERTSSGERPNYAAEIDLASARASESSGAGEGAMRDADVRGAAERGTVPDPDEPLAEVRGASGVTMDWSDVRVGQPMSAMSSGIAPDMPAGVDNRTESGNVSNESHYVSGRGGAHPQADEASDITSQTRDMLDPGEDESGVVATSVMGINAEAASSEIQRPARAMEDMAGIDERRVDAVSGQQAIGVPSSASEAVGSVNVSSYTTESAQAAHEAPHRGPMAHGLAGTGGIDVEAGSPIRHEVPVEAVTASESAVLRKDGIPRIEDPTLYTEQSRDAATAGTGSNDVATDHVTADGHRNTAGHAPPVRRDGERPDISARVPGLVDVGHVPAPVGNVSGTDSMVSPLMTSSTPVGGEMSAPAAPRMPSKNQAVRDLDEPVMGVENAVQTDDALPTSPAGNSTSPSAVPASDPASQPGPERRRRRKKPASNIAPPQDVPMHPDDSEIN